MFGEPRTPPGEVALDPDTLQLLVGWHLPGLRPADLRAQQGHGNSSSRAVITGPKLL